MTYFKTAFAATTALTLSMGASYADPNTLFLDQDGDNNSAVIEQDIVGFYGDDAGGNDFGTASNHALQQGDGNDMSFKNGTKNYHSNLSAGDNDVLEAKQLGDNNKMYIENNSYGSSGDTASSGNTIESAIQDGDNNYVNFVRQNADNGTVETAYQEGNRNFLRIVQLHGNGNSVGTASQIGSNNGFNQYNNTRQGIYIRQGGVSPSVLGNNNRVEEASIVGSNNGSIADQPGIYIEQFGSDNGLSSSTAQIFGSYNQIRVMEAGDGNNFSVVQGNSAAAGSENIANLDQTGNYNDAAITQDGSRNYVTARQYGDSNLLTATFVGNDNGVGTMDGVAGALADLSATDDLFQGNIFQDSTTGASGNTISYVVNGNNNLFAFAQIGGANTIDGQVGNAGASNGNQVAVLQNGSGNGTTFTQNGGGNNNLAVSQ